MLDKISGQNFILYLSKIYSLQENNILTNFLYSNYDENPLIPYAKYGGYTFISHFISFVNNQKKILFECRMLIELNVIRNQSFQFIGLSFDIMPLRALKHSANYFYFFPDSNIHNWV